MDVCANSKPECSKRNAGHSAGMHSGIDEAHRSVQELLGTG